MKQQIDQFKIDMMQVPKSLRKMIWIIAVMPSFLFVPLIWVLYNYLNISQEILSFVFAGHPAYDPAIAIGKLDELKGIIESVANTRIALVILSASVIAAGFICGVFALLIPIGGVSKNAAPQK